MLINLASLTRCHNSRPGASMTAVQFTPRPGLPCGGYIPAPPPHLQPHGKHQGCDAVTRMGRGKKKVFTFMDAFFPVLLPRFLIQHPRPSYTIVSSRKDKSSPETCRTFAGPLVIDI